MEYDGIPLAVEFHHIHSVRVFTVLRYSFEMDGSVNWSAVWTRYVYISIARKNLRTLIKLELLLIHNALYIPTWYMTKWVSTQIMTGQIKFCGRLKDGLHWNEKCQ